MSKTKQKLLQKIFAAILTAVLLLQPLAAVQVLAQEATPTPSPTPTQEISAQNSNTGSDSTNQSDSSSSQTTSVTNNNEATVNNNVTTDANTGNNSVLPTPTPEVVITEPSPTPTPTPPAEQDLASPDTPIPSPEPTPTITTEETATDSGSVESLEPTPSPTLEASQSATATNLNTGENSENTANAASASDTEITNNNTATVSSQLSLVADTGGNSATGAGSEIVTGDAQTHANLVNLVNTNLTGSDFWQTIINLFATNSNDLDLTQLEGYSHFSPELISAIAQNTNTGDGSINLALATILSSFSVYNANTATVANEVAVSANTGDNTASGDGSSVQTGGASAQANVFNLVNTNLTGANWFFGVINLFAQQYGDIILPYELQFLLGPEATGAATIAEATNTTTGAGSQNTSQANVTSSLAVINTNTAAVTNNVEVNANTGNNTINGTGTIKTGNAQAVANLFNIINSNITGSRWLLLIINNAGSWNGQLLGWWGNTLSIGNTTYAWVQLPGADPLMEGASSAAINENTGENSTNESAASATTSVSVTDTNLATVTNNIAVGANSGGNTTGSSKDVIQTGDTTASANLVNIVNTNIFGNNWFLGIINIFDSLFGNIIFPRPDLVVTKTADKASVQPGGNITYTITVKNQGKLWAKHTTVTDTLPAGAALVSASDDGIYQNGVVTWNFFKIWPGQTKTLTVIIRVDANLSCGDQLTNTASTSTQTDEPNKDNNNASVTVAVVTANCPAPTPTPTPPPGGGGGVGGPGGGGGSTGGAQACSDAAPAGAPKLLSATSGVNSVTLTWSPAPDPVTYYLVAYGRSPGIWEYGNPNIGGRDTTSYTINNLSGGTTYYFVVRAGNGCTPGPFSHELATTPTGGEISGPATGFGPGILGTSTEEEQQIVTPSGEIAGEVVDLTTKPICWWWLILALAEAILLAIAYWYWGNKRPRYWWLLPVILAALAFTGDQVIAHRFVTPSRWCDWEWLWVTLAAAVPSAIYLFLNKPRAK